MDFFRARCMFHAPEYTTFLRLSKRPKSSSGKVHIPATIRMIIKFSCAVPDIDQLVFLLSIPKMQNLERNMMGFDPGKVLIKMSLHSKHVEKIGDESQVIHREALSFGHHPRAFETCRQILVNTNLHHCGS